MNNFVTAIGVILIIAVTVGLIYLIAYDFESDNKRFEEKCAQIAKLSGVTEYKADYSTCYLLKDGKIEVVE